MTFSKPIIVVFITCMICLIDVSVVKASPVSDSENKGPTMQQIYKSSRVPKTYADFSMFHFVPKGSIITEQPERGRLIFRNRATGQPAGHAEIKGRAILYYDPSGKPVRLQKLTDAELNQWLMHNARPQY